MVFLKGGVFTDRAKVLETGYAPHPRLATASWEGRRGQGPSLNPPGLWGPLASADGFYGQKTNLTPLGDGLLGTRFDEERSEPR